MQTNHTAQTTSTQEVGHPTSYQEMTLNGTLYRVTSVYKGNIDLKSALEELAVRRVARQVQQR